MYWTLWSPLMFVTYGDDLIRRRGESGFPARPSQRRLDRWWARNAGQRELVLLAIAVCILMFAGIAAVNAVFAKPLVPILHEQVAYRMILFALFFSVFWVCQLAAGWLIARENGNVGFLLIAGLPLAVLAAILLQFAIWLPYAAIYLQEPSLAGRAVFLIWGFGVGYCINFALAMLKVEPPRPSAVVAWYLGGILVAFLYLFLLSGTPAQPLSAILGSGTGEYLDNVAPVEPWVPARLCAPAGGVLLLAAAAAKHKPLDAGKGVEHAGRYPAAQLSRAPCARRMACAGLAAGRARCDCTLLCRAPAAAPRRGGQPPAGGDNPERPAGETGDGLRQRRHMRGLTW